MEFLENPNHRIRFAYTPKHCSWLHPIEYWLSKLQRQRLKNASFNSEVELEDSIPNYINYTNLWNAQPLRWMFCGFKYNNPETC